MWLRWIWNSTFWLGVENLKKIQRIWQNTKYNMMFQTQEVGKCYLFLSFTHFLWTYILQSKPIIKTPLRPFPEEKKNLVNDLENIIAYLEGSGQSEVFGDKCGSFQKQMGGLGWWQQCSSKKNLQFLPSFNLGKCFQLLSCIKIVT